MKVYFDNAASTPIDHKVAKLMYDSYLDDFGNPSSIHQYGRKSKTIIERCRKKIADIMGTSPGEIFFTSGGTEADNMVLHHAAINLGYKNIITSPIEHHAVLHALNYLSNKKFCNVHYVEINKMGEINLEHLEQLLTQFPEALVSLMHINNEIGTILPLQKVSEICSKHKALFHSDTVQSIGHYPFNFKETNIDFIACSAHKFHGPKGVGFVYINSKNTPQPFIHGGAQERGVRGGTENTQGIIGLTEALEISNIEYAENFKKILDLKTYFIKSIQSAFPDVAFNGTIENDKSSYRIVNICLPKSDKAEMMLFNLDILGVCVSSGSACTSGTNIGSHVLKAIGSDMNKPSFRFSFSKYNTKDEVDYAIKQLKNIYS